MFVSQKSRYALRAIFELARRNGNGNEPVKIGEIARAQAIPPRFLEVILSQLKQAGFVDSKRGNEGGYYLTASPDKLTIGDVLNFLQGPVDPVGCLSNDNKDNCPLKEDCVFLPMWERVKGAVSEIYDNTTFQDLVEQERRKAQGYVPNYFI
ncbi:MAG: Rrf2 family transcriptional regulator [Myxococcota bacterium]